MKHRNSHFAVGYWSRIRHGRAAPDQADIDPKVLKRLLPFVFLLDARPDGTFVHRLAGTALCERYGGEVRRRHFLRHLDDDNQATLNAVLHQAVGHEIASYPTSVGTAEDCRQLANETE